jgi:hypothetical protein
VSKILCIVQFQVHLNGGRSHSPLTWDEKAEVAKLVGEDELLRKWCTRIEFLPEVANISVALPEGIGLDEVKKAEERIQLGISAWFHRKHGGLAFEPGNVVRLKSDGPSMTVVK